MPSAERQAPPCPLVAEGCGGCDLQHARPDGQPELKVGIVVDALRRLGGIDEPPVVAGGALPAEGFRTTVRAGVDARGRAGIRRARSHEPVIGRCLVAHPLVDELLAEARFPGAEEVTVRVGARTGERLVVVEPSAVEAAVPDGVRVVGADELAEGRRAWFHEEVAGRRWRISAGSFFQTRPDGAEALIEAVRSAAGHALAPGSRVVDAYGGVGLLAGALTEGWDGADLARVQLVERAASSVADARVNLRPVGGASGVGGGRGRDGAIRVVRSDVGRWRPAPADLVVADPARAGLGRRGADRLAGTRAPVLVLVSCDAASLGRDAALLSDHGFELVEAVVVDLFPHTHHVEVVSRFVRA